MAPGDYPVVATLENYWHVEETVTVSQGAKAYKTLHFLPMVPTEDEARRQKLRKKPSKPGGAYDF